MKTSLLRNTLLILCAFGLSITTAAAEVIHSTYIGPIGGNWSDPANWSPAIVPNNTGHQEFVVSLASEIPGVTLDIDVRLKKLKLTGDNLPTVTAIDHSLRSGATSLSVDFPHEQYGGGYFTAVALTRNVVADFGNLADFSRTTFKTGLMSADASAAAPGITSKIQFNGADIRATNGYIGIFGAGSRIVDQHGRDTR